MDKFVCPEPTEQAFDDAYGAHHNALEGGRGKSFAWHLALKAAYEVDVPGIVKAEVQRALDAILGLPGTDGKRYEPSAYWDYLTARFGEEQRECGMGDDNCRDGTGCTRPKGHYGVHYHHPTGREWSPVPERGEPQPIEAVTLEGLVAYGRANGANIVNGMPWSFFYKGLPVSHERDDLYLVTTPTHTLRVDAGSLLATWSDGRLTILDRREPDAFAHLRLPSADRARLQRIETFLTALAQMCTMSGGVFRIEFHGAAGPEVPDVVDAARTYLRRDG